MIHSVIQVIPFDNYTVSVYFDDGKIVLFDVKPLLGKKVFQPLNDIMFYKSACTILNDTLAWDLSGDRDESNCIDIDPDTLYALEHVGELIA